MNLNLFGYRERFLMVDCGITFDHPNGALRPTIEMPDPRFIVGRRQLLDALIVTHAHEDHLGAIPHIWPQLKCPIFATPFAAALIRNKFTNLGMQAPEELVEVSPGEQRTIGHFNVTWMPITHSTPETCALLIETPSHRVFHTADWKVDNAPGVGVEWAEASFARLGQLGVDALICDSTNALKPGHSPSEAQVAAGLLKVVSPLKGRVVIACFASNIARMRAVFRLAKATNRRVGLLGRSLENMYRCARQCDLLAGEYRPIEASHLGYLPEQEVLALATGSQGEVGAALHRLAMDSHRHLSLSEGDTVVFSSKTIPGNEVAVARLVEGLKARGIQIIHADDCAEIIHASGHPCEDELRHLYQLTKPKLVIPVHGEDAHMKRNAEIARSEGVPMALTGGNGDLFWLAPTPGIRRRHADVGRLQWDERERKLLAK